MDRLVRQFCHLVEMGGKPGLSSTSAGRSALPIPPGLRRAQTLKLQRRDFAVARKYAAQGPGLVAKADFVSAPRKRDLG